MTRSITHVCGCTHTVTLETDLDPKRLERLLKDLAKAPCAVCRSRAHTLTARQLARARAAYAAKGASK